MPTALQLSLVPEVGTRPRIPTPAQLHGAISGLFDADETSHREQDKPWSMRPASLRDGLLEVRCSWFGETNRHLGALEGGRLRLGSAWYRVDHVGLHQVSRTELAAMPMTRCTLEFESPTWFSRNGRRYPLPDPPLAYLSLHRRWSLGATARDEVPGEVLDELLDHLMVRDFDGRSEAIDLAGRTRVGFVGTATFSLTRAAGAEAQHAFGALSRFAEFGGIGAETSWGAGAVRVLDWR